MSKKYKKFAEWLEMKPTLEKEIDAGTPLVTLAFYYDVSERRMREILDELELPTPEKRTREKSAHEAELDLQQVEWYGLHPDDLVEITARPTCSTQDGNGNGRAFNPARFEID